MYTKHFLTDKNPYRSYQWSHEQKTEILKKFTLMIASLNLASINVIIDKTRITIKNYHILENALTYNVQRIENDSQGDWNFLLITDKSRIAPMRKTARAIRAFNPIHSQFGGYINKPIKNMIEDVLEKDSMESLTKRPAPKNMDWSSTLRNKNTTYDVFTFSVVQFDCPIKFLVCQRFALL